MKTAISVIAAAAVGASLFCVSAADAQVRVRHGGITAGIGVGPAFGGRHFHGGFHRHGGWGWRGRHWGWRGPGWGWGGAALAGATLGLIGAAAASTAYPYAYYDDGYPYAYNDFGPDYYYGSYAPATYAYYGDEDPYWYGGTRAVYGPTYTTGFRTAYWPRRTYRSARYARSASAMAYGPTYRSSRVQYRRSAYGGRANVRSARTTMRTGARYRTGYRTRADVMPARTTMRGSASYRARAGAGPVRTSARMGDGRRSEARAAVRSRR